MQTDQQTRLAENAKQHAFYTKAFSREGMSDQQKQEIFDRIQALKDERIKLMEVDNHAAQTSKRTAHQERHKSLRTESSLNTAT